MKPLIIGEAPSKNEVTEHPIEGRIAARLASYCDLSVPEFLKHFERVNLLHIRQDTKEKGFVFDMTDAIKSAAALVATEFRTDRVILLLGFRVAGAFGVRCEYFVQANHPWLGGADVRILPHPSGVNRWWNSPLNKMHAREFMLKVVERTR